MRYFKILLSTCLLLTSCTLFAAQNPITGYWQTIDHSTNKPSSLIYIWYADNQFYGKVAKIYAENSHKTNDRCWRCKGEFYGKPILGLRIIRALIEDRPAHYTNGLVLDPENGAEYHCNATVMAEGKELHLRGYIGIPLLGRTDVWYHVPASAMKQ